MLRFLSLLFFLFVSVTGESQSLISDRLVYDFGKVNYGEDITSIFTLKNVSDTTITIFHCKPSSNVVSIDCPLIKIEPNQTSNLVVKYDTKKEGPINKSITIDYLCRTEEFLILRIRGTVLSKDRP